MLLRDIFSQATAQLLHISAHNLRMSLLNCESRMAKFEHIWHISAQSFAVCIVFESTPPLVSSATQHFWHSLQASTHCCTSFDIIWVVIIVPLAFSALAKRALSTFPRSP
jgi:hypothetical protein